MKKKSTTSRSGFFGSHVFVPVMFCTAVSCLFVGGASPVTGAKFGSLGSEVPAKASQRTLTFAERLAYQRTIEAVYWRHGIWPEERPDAKPSFDAVMTQAQLEKKVTDFARNSHVLEDYWHHPLTAEQLQAEMDRMARHTKQPEVLHELFAALGKDPFVIAECLARPVLTERLIADLSLQGEAQPFESPKTDGLRTISAITSIGGASYTLPKISGADNLPCTDDAWTATGTTKTPAARFTHTAVWTGSEMIIWGGLGANTGGRYNPATDSWLPTSIANSPVGRELHTAVWTGTEMIVWGGFFDEGGGTHELNTGGKYNPRTNSWTATNTTNAPTARAGHQAVWTGSEMIVWGGGDDSGPLNTGGRYNPGTDSWRRTSATNAPNARFGPTVVWTGSEMIVWGGFLYYGTYNYLNTGGRYNPVTNTWIASSIALAPTGRSYHTAVWTGNEMIVWGGLGDFGALNTGGKYDPATDRWTATSTTNAPSARESHTAVWTGDEMIVWGGYGGAYLNTGGRYSPGTDSWMATSTTNAPDARYSPTAVWTGTQMIVWGGTDDARDFNTGGRYCAPPEQLGNISTRSFVQTGDNVMIGGFIVQGTGSKRVIIRAIGPELTQYGVPNVLANPTLELHDGMGALIASNNNWATTIIGGIITASQVRDIQASGHAPADGRESAIVTELQAGNYTAIVRGVNDTTGVALVEVYDLGGSDDSILGNISTRSFVQTGDNVMIGGFIVQGAQPKRVIVRAIGPELTQYGVPDVLANPSLELHNGTGALIGSNDDWQHTIIGGVIRGDQVADIRNSGHAPSAPSESAIIAELPPGNYTAIVRGVNNTTGVALVEVYDLR